MNLEGQREQQYVENVMDRLTLRFGAARLPKKVKRQEAPYQGDVPTGGDIVNQDGVPHAPMRLNAGWFDLTEEPGGMTPVEGVVYLWVIRGDGHLILGVEDPTKFPQAFGTDVSGLKSVDGLGHPTLAATFGAGGELDVGEGRIGGELFHEGGWVINDHSGRYGSGRGDTTALLVEAAEYFRAFGIDVQGYQSKEGTADKVVKFGVQ
ncbi:MAG TPA: hypothetical protein VFV67_01055 [Actinophytocola sp.]|uniref:hypothetical protein n=1 Tax=Actinophytocola sp. TaxID=1872138 RepID=UPI002DB807FB|nr:hypothetical protein [Actinophytocola sp.]HEU5469212.1 hypothetical protein [Actinophytocola sp.]